MDGVERFGVPPMFLVVARSAPSLSSRAARDGCRVLTPPFCSASLPSCIVPRRGLSFECSRLCTHGANDPTLAGIKYFCVLLLLTFMIRGS